MHPALFTQIFLFALLTATAVKFWLALRQISHVSRHRLAVPEAFRNRIELAAHQKAADYTIANVRLSLFSILFDAALLLVFTLGGGIQWLSNWANAAFDSALLQGVAVIAAALLLTSVLETPFNLYHTFVIEARFGFNRMTWRLYLADALKGLLLAAVIALPLLLGVLWLMTAMGADWWLYVWGVWAAFNLLILFIYPNFIAPMFNKFEPIQESELKTRIETLLAKCGFASSGLFVMDGSKRSAHGNAYFTGFGKTKRIVFFDTLLQRLAPNEVEAVLAHELGHFKKRHILKRIAYSFALSLLFLWGLSHLMQTTWFYAGLGVYTPSTALALLLFFMVLPTFSFLFHPIAAYWSRKHEFEADGYAVQQTGASQLSSALVKLYQDNAKTLTPDPLYAAFYESHPPAMARIAHLERSGASL